MCVDRGDDRISLCFTPFLMRGRDKADPVRFPHSPDNGRGWRVLLLMTLRVLPSVANICRSPFTLSTILGILDPVTPCAPDCAPTVLDDHAAAESPYGPLGGGRGLAINPASHVNHHSLDTGGRVRDP